MLAFFATSSLSIELAAHPVLTGLRDPISSLLQLSIIK